MKIIDSLAVRGGILEARRGGAASTGSAWQREMERAQTLDWFHGPLQQVGRSAAESGVHEFSPSLARSSARTLQVQASSSSQRFVAAALKSQMRSEVAVTPAEFGSGTSVPVGAEAGTGNPPVLKRAVARQSAGLAAENRSDLLLKIPEPQAAAPLSMSGVQIPQVDVPSLFSDALSAALDASVNGGLPEGEVEEGTVSASSLSARIPPAAPPSERTLPIRVHQEFSGSTVQLWLGVDASIDWEQSVPTIVQAVRQQWFSRGYHLASVVCNGRVIYSGDQGEADAVGHIRRIYQLEA